MIKNLAAEADKYIERWLGVVRHHGAYDREAARVAVGDMYSLHHRPPPKCIVWAQSPPQAEVIAGILLGDYPSNKKDILWARASSDPADYAWARETFLNGAWARLRSESPRIRVAMESAAARVAGVPGLSPRGAMRNAACAIAGTHFPISTFSDAHIDRLINIVGMEPHKAMARLNGAISAAENLQHEFADAALRHLMPGNYLLLAARQQRQSLLSVSLAASVVFAREVLSEFHRRDDVGVYERLHLSGAARQVWTFPGVCLLTEPPVSRRLDDRGRAHSPDSPALEYSDGWAVHAIHGVRVHRRVVERPDKITLLDIDSQRNVEVRRVIIERYGIGRYMRSRGTLVDSSSYGRLYNLYFSNDEAIKTLRVRNSTPEPDGTYKQYVLRVPPEMRSAREAVAWSFGEGPYSYTPEAES